MIAELKSTSKIFGGEQRTYGHRSPTLSCDMKFAAFVPPGKGPFPVLLWLSGLTCTEENFSIKAGAQRAAAAQGVLLLIPDTSPRGEGVPGDPQGAWDFGLGAGFYVDATEDPYAKNYRMRSYIERELLDVAAQALPADMARLSISGHSMGGHGALTVALRNPQRFRSVSAFAPICSPINCPWGLKAFNGYLGPNLAKWRAYDACALIEDGARLGEILVDQGSADVWMEAQLKPELLEAQCQRAGVKLNLRRQAGYDHGYYFVSTFIDEHIAWHRARMG